MTTLHGRIQLDHLKAWRAFHQLTLEELANRSGVAMSTIVRLEHRKSQSYAATVKRLAAALDVTPEQLLAQPQKKTNPQSRRTAGGMGDVW